MAKTLVQNISTNIRCQGYLSGGRPNQLDDFTPGIYERVDEDVHRRKQAAMKAVAYQLWINDFGKNPDAVLDYIVKDMAIDQNEEGPLDFPDAPWMLVELPAGSDTYSIVHIKAGELTTLGAKVSVRNVKPFMAQVLLAVLGTALVVGIVFALMLNSARTELREMHEHEVQESLRSD